MPLALNEDRSDLDIKYISIPCGKCARCIERRKIEWGFRMEKEMEVSKTAYFVTLTYAPETVPYSTTYWDKELKEERIKKTYYGNKTLNPYDLEKFFKRLRQNQKRSKETIEWLYNNLQPNDKIKYYACGEYGENNTKRPHYHAIIFNASKVNIEKSWELGETHVVPANRQTIAYVMKYLDKRIGKEKDWKRYPEYNTMSEGIGLCYLDKNKKWHKKNIDILFVSNHFGFKIPMPRYYRMKIFNEDERQDQLIIVTDKMEELKQEKIKEFGSYETYCNAQLKLKKETEKRFRKKIKKRIID